MKASNFAKIRFSTGVFFVNFLKISKARFFLMRCKNFLKVYKSAGEIFFAKYLSAHSCFVKTIMLLSVMITRMLSVS